MKVEVGLDADGKLRLITINYFNRQLVATKKINRCTALLPFKSMMAKSLCIQNGDIVR